MYFQRAENEIQNQELDAEQLKLFEEIKNTNSLIDTLHDSSKRKF